MNKGWEIRANKNNFGYEYEISKDAMIVIFTPNESLFSVIYKIGSDEKGVFNNIAENQAWAKVESFISNA